MFIQTEETPNPSTLKFIPGKVLLENGTQEFKSKQSAKSNSLASMLFEDENVDGVFIGKDFITITKSNEVNWESLKPSILSKIHDFLSSGKKIESKKKNNKKVRENYNKKDLGIVKQIKDLLEERIKPAVAQDGGDISFVKFDNGVVYLELRGACAGCPSSTITLKSGIENMLKYYIPEIVSVEAVNQS
jgi:Fe-S cluster biogenesis protein NfuA